MNFAELGSNLFHLHCSARLQAHHLVNRVMLASDGGDGREDHLLAELRQVQTRGVRLVQHFAHAGVRGGVKAGN